MIISRERFHRETGFSVSQFTLVAVPFPVPVPVPVPDSRFPGFPYAPGYFHGAWWGGGGGRLLHKPNNRLWLRYGYFLEPHNIFL